MRYRKYAWLAITVMIACELVLSIPADVWAGDLENERFVITVREDGGLHVQLKGGSAVIFRPDFIILYNEKDPKLAFRPGDFGKVSYNVATWYTGQEGDKTNLKKVDTTKVAGDGFDPSVLQGDSQGRTSNYLHAAPIARISAKRPNIKDNVVRCEFPAHPSFHLSAQVELPQGDAFPVLTVRFRPSTSGYYSIGYAGAPENEPAAVDDVWQPLLWQGKRFPKQSFLTMAYRCPIPTALTTHNGYTVGVVADPNLLPFEPLPTSANSRFGVLVRNENGKAQPMLFSPVLGGEGSLMQGEKTFTFSAHLALCHGNTMEAFEQVARGIYGFRDFRRNVDFSMNQTLHNMIDYGLSEYSHFDEDLRGCSYATDVPGAVKNVSALHPLSAALVTDNPEIYHRRARPIIEYMVSREKFLFAVSPEVKIQSPSWKLNGPCAPVSELSALYLMTGRQNPVFLDLAIQMLDKTRILNLDVAERGRTWNNLLAVYRASGDARFLREAIDKAQGYVKYTSTLHNDLAAEPRFFWTTFVPKFQELLEIYSETGDHRYLDAAHLAARRFAQFIWMCPKIPDQEIEVNPNDEVPHYWYLRSKGHPPMKSPSELVPAWRLSEIGLTCESSGTSTGHRAILIANHAPWLLRLSHLKNDPFLNDIARSAIVGRYANFPGYHINTGRTTVYEKAGYPLRPHHELSYNSFHYNHIWPHISLLIDYMLTEVEVLSNGQIQFPSSFAEGYAYLKNRVYGDQPGKFYDVEDVWLWMPEDVVKVDNPQLNFVTARTEDSFIVALTNQSFETQQTTVRINRDLVAIPQSCRVRQWENNSEGETHDLQGDAVEIRLAPRGITCFQLQNAEVTPKFTPTDNPIARKSVSRAIRMSEFADGTRAYLIASGTGFRSAYIFVKATQETVKRVTLKYLQGEATKQLMDDRYPYEFTVLLDSDEQELEFSLTAESNDGSMSHSEQLKLGRDRN